MFCLKTSNSLTGNIMPTLLDGFLCTMLIELNRKLIKPNRETDYKPF